MQIIVVVFIVNVLIIEIYVVIDIVDDCKDGVYDIFEVDFIMFSIFGYCFMVIVE